MSFLPILYVGPRPPGSYPFCRHGTRGVGRVAVPALPGTGRTSQPTVPARTVEAVDSRTEIRDFLTSRRARISPEQAGLPVYGANRRVAGLRREEVAMLAGV